MPRRWRPAEAGAQDGRAALDASPSPVANSTRPDETPRPYRPRLPPRVRRPPYRERDGHHARRRAPGHRRLPPRARRPAAGRSPPGPAAPHALQQSRDRGHRGRVPLLRRSRLRGGEPGLPRLLRLRGRGELPGPRGRGRRRHHRLDPQAGVVRRYGGRVRYLMVGLDADRHGRAQPRGPGHHGAEHERRRRATRRAYATAARSSCASWPGPSGTRPTTRRPP